MTIVVTPEYIKFEHKAKKIAGDLNLNYQSKIFFPKEQKKGLYFLVVNEDKPYLLSSSGTEKPIYCNFLDWMKGSFKSNLSRCLKGVRKDPFIVDATAGFGRDAIELARHARKIILVEREKWLVFLIKNSLVNSPDNSILQKVEVLNMDSNKYLSSLTSLPDVIYLDPMFVEESLSKAKKHLQLLRENTTRACNKNLLSLSLSKAKDRVVVKRHKKQEYLESKNPTYSIKGKVIRFDVYKV